MCIGGNKTYLLLRIWGIKTRFECKECNNIYPGSEFMKCLRHTANPAYNSEGLEGRGVYPCCNKVVLKFMPFAALHVRFLNSYARDVTFFLMNPPQNLEKYIIYF